MKRTTDGRHSHTHTGSKNQPTKPIAAAALLCLGLCAALPVAAQFKVNSSFRNSTEPGWTITGTDNLGTNDSGILTGGYGAVPNGVNDSNGNGWLRLTTNLGGQSGRALYSGGTVSPQFGIIVEFDYVSWGGTGADGLSVFLYDASGTMAGALAGASLGYCKGNGAYLGIGLDEFGNFSSAGASGGCSGGGGPGSTPDSVVVRGPASTNNIYIGGATVASGVDSPGALARPTPNRVRYFLVPNGSGGYRISVAYGAAGAAPTTVVNALDFLHVAPTQLRIGIAGSTGGSTNIHEVRNLAISTPADIAVTKTVSAASILRGQPVTYTVTVRNNDINANDPGDQSPNIDASNAPDINDALPAQLTGKSWTCSASVGSTCPAASGTGNLAVADGYTLAKGGVLTFTLTGTVATTATCGATIANTATADFSATDGFSDINTANNSASVNFTVACPTLQVQKISNGGIGTFNFSGDNGIQAHDIVTATAGTAVAGATQTLSAAGAATTVTESDPPAGFSLTGIACTGLGVGGVATPNLATRSVLLDAAATRTVGPIVCTFSNSKQPVLRLQKALPLGRFSVSDQFALSISGPGGPAVATTTGVTNTPAEIASLNPATIGGVYVLNETGAGGANLANYATGYSCSNALAGGQTPSGSGASFNLTAVAGDDLTCTFSNTRNPLADLSITKTNTPGINGDVDQANDTLTRGATTVYTIRVVNHGPDGVTGAVLRDPIAGRSGLSCNTPPTCSGAACPAGPLSVAQLDSGVTLGALANGAAVVVSLSCVVN